MAYVQADLVKAVLQDLERLGNSETVDADDSDAIVARLPGIMADLSAHRILAGVSSLATIPDSLFSDLVKVVAERCAPLFGRPTNEDALAAAQGRLAKAARLDRASGTHLTLAVLEQIEFWGAGSSALDGTAVADRIGPALAALAGRTRGVVYFADEADVYDRGAALDVARWIAAYLAPKSLPGELREAERALRLMAIGQTARAPLRAEYF